MLCYQSTSCFKLCVLLYANICLIPVYKLESNKIKFDSSVQTNLGSWGFEGITGGKCCVALCFCAGHNTLPWKCVLCKGTWHVTFSCFVTRGPSLVQQKIRCVAQSGISVMNVWGLVRSIFAVLVVTILRVWLLFKWMKETWIWRKNNYSWGGGKKFICTSLKEISWQVLFGNQDSSRECPFLKPG